MSITGVFDETTRKIQFQDGAGHYLTISPVKTNLTIAHGDPTLTEAMHRQRHLTGQAPVVNDVGDPNCTGSMAFYIDLQPTGVVPADDATRPMTWLTASTASAAGLTSTVAGTAWSFKILVVDVQPGKTQTRTYSYCAPEKPTESYDGGLLLYSFSFTDREKFPTIVDGDTTLS